MYTVISRGRCEKVPHLISNLHFRTHTSGFIHGLTEMRLLCSMIGTIQQTPLKFVTEILKRVTVKTDSKKQKHKCTHDFTQTNPNSTNKVF